MLVVLTEFMLVFGLFCVADPLPTSLGTSLEDATLLAVAPLADVVLLVPGPVLLVVFGAAVLGVTIPVASVDP